MTPLAEIHPDCVVDFAKDRARLLFCHHIPRKLQYFCHRYHNRGLHRNIVHKTLNMRIRLCWCDQNAQSINSANTKSNRAPAGHTRTSIPAGSRSSTASGDFAEKWNLFCSCCVSVGALSCMGEYRSGLRARLKSPDMPVSIPTELSDAQNSVMSPNTYGRRRTLRRSLRLSLPRLEIVPASAQPSVGSQVRSRRLTRLSKPRCTKSSSAIEARAP